MYIHMYILCTCIIIILFTVHRIYRCTKSMCPTTTLCTTQVSDIVENYSVWKCYAAGTLPFILDIIIFIYLSLLQFVGIILAFQTRKVNITALNDSKSITALIYISSIVLVVIVLITFILRSYINISAAVFSGGIIVLATFFLVLIFVPKVSVSLFPVYTGIAFVGRCI